MSLTVADDPLDRAPAEGERRLLVRIRRQDTPADVPRWEEFSIPHRPRMNVISCLQYIATHPLTADGKPTTSPVWDSSCLEEVCGACTMLVNGRARQACSTLVDQLGGEVIVLEPLGKFPVVRDLIVDRSRLFEDLKRVKAWVPIDGTYDLGPAPDVDPPTQARRYPLTQCISCGCCLEACPQYTPANRFVGAAVISQVRLFNEHPIGKALKDDRLDEMMADGGVADCGKAGNCVEVCPKKIPLLESIAIVQRQTTGRAIRRWFVQ